MKILLLFALLTTLCTNTFALSPIKDATDFFLKADAFFKEYAIKGNIKYSNLKQNHADLELLVNFIGKTPIN